LGDLATPCRPPRDSGQAYNETVEDIVLGILAAVGGLALIVWRRQFAASTVRQQNWFWRTKYGPPEVAFTERAAILLGVFSLAMALSFWLDLFWPPVIVLGGGVLGLNLLRLRRRVSKQ
jgi:hypothetical protein